MGLPDTDTADTYFYWSENESTDHARRGHAYLFARDDVVECWALQHAKERTAGMVERLNRWQAAHPESDEVRLRRCHWRQPDGPYGFNADLGHLQRLLRGRAWSLEAAFGTPPPVFPESFLRAPVRTRIEAALPGIRWPAEWNSEVLRFAYGSPTVARDGDRVVVCAARYGSEYTDMGQDRTAAVFLSGDGGQTFEELPWAQEVIPEGQTCWPPETIARPRFEEGRLVAPWEDPWIDWEPGFEWEGTWDPDARTWSVVATW